MSVQLAPPSVVMSRNPPAGADRDPVQVGRADAEVVGARAESPGGRQAGRGRTRWRSRSGSSSTRRCWSATRARSRSGRRRDRSDPGSAGAGTIAVKKPKPTSLRPEVAAGPVLEDLRRGVAEVRAHAGALRAADHGVGVGLAVGRSHAVAADHLVVDGAVVGAQARAVVLRAADDEVREASGCRRRCSTGASPARCSCRC